MKEKFIFITVIIILISILVGCNSNQVITTDSTTAINIDNLFYLDVETNNNIVPVENITNIHANMTMTDALDILGPSLPGSDDTSSISCWNRVWQLSDGTKLKLCFISQHPSASSTTNSNSDKKEPVYIQEEDLQTLTENYSEVFKDREIIVVDREQMSSLIKQHMIGFTAKQAFILDENNKTTKELF